MSSQRLTSNGAPRRPLRTALFSLVAAGAAFAYVSPVTYRSEAVIGVGSSTTPLREAMTEAAVATAVSKPVMARAASSLIGTQVAAPAPGVFDKLFVMVGWGQPTASDARLAETLTAQVTARAGDAPGVIKISATSPQATSAARIATTVAEALIDEQDVQAIDARRRREADTARTIESLKTNAANAHRQLAALGGGAEIDPAQARATAASQTAAAQARLDVVRGILASGSPPISDRHDLPQNAATLQAAYLDLSQQLSKARETLGDKHTTVVSLQQGVKSAAANLTAEWKRLSKVAEADVEAARGREAALSKNIAPADPKKRAALDEARRNVAISDEALERAKKNNAEAPADDNSYRLVAPAPIPSQATGFAVRWRLVLSIFAGLTAIFAMRLQPRFASLRRSSSLSAAPISSVVAPASNRFFDDGQVASDTRATRHAERTEPALAMPPAARRPVLAPEGDLPPDLDDLMPALDAIEPQGTLRLVLVGSNEEGEATTPLALALSQAAATDGHRVLLIEAQSSEGALAACADADGDPILIDIFGQLRVAMPAADIDEGFLFVAPGLRNGDQITQRLARSGEVVLLDDLSDEFDLVVVDGGQVSQSIDMIPPADAFLRVGRHPSKRDDQRFLATCGASGEAFLGTITSSAFIPRDETPARWQTSVERASGPTPFVSRVPRSTTGTVIELPVGRRRVASR